MVDDDFSGAGPFTQTMTLRGNVIVQKTSSLNNLQVIAMYNDAGLANLTLNVRTLYNTFVGNGGSAAFVHVSNADHTHMSAELSDNIISGTTRPFLIEDSATGSATGVNNSLKTGATVGALTGSVLSAAPGFRNAAGQDFTLTNGSPCINAASAAVFGLPGREYYLNETNSRHAARNIGAFESTSTNNPTGPYDAPPRPQLKATLQPGAGSMTITVPLFAQDFLLEQSAVGVWPMIWSITPVSLVTNGGGIFAALPMTGSGSLFRLRR